MKKVLNSRNALRLTAILLLVVLLVPGALAASINCKINTSTKVYAKASSSAPSINVGKNTTVSMTGYNGKWATITRGGVTAYIPMKYLTFTKPLTAYAKSGAKLYKSASSSSSRICELSSGTTVYVIGADEGYFRVQNSGGSVKGWVKMKYVSWTRPSSGSGNAPKASGSTKLARMLSVAQALVGRPYSSSCREPQSFDCSHFVSYCFKQVGINVSSACKSLGYSKKLTRINSISDLKVGDILVFDTDPNDNDVSDHVAIYIGGGKFVHASYSAGKVIVSSFTKYYKKVFSWGLRTSI